MNKVILLAMIFMAPTFIQAQEATFVENTTLRVIDRHLKTMVNMHFEIDTLSAERMRLKTEIKLLLATVDNKDDKIGEQLDIIDGLQIREAELVDTANYYKILDYGNGVHIADLNNLVITPLRVENKSLKKENKILTWAIGVLTGAFATYLIF